MHVHQDREVIGVTLGVLNEDASAAVDLLLSAFSRDVNLSSESLQAEKEILHRRNLEFQRDQLEQTYSGLFETTFRDHSMGLPVLGIRDNAANLTLQQMEDFRDTNFTGPSVVLSVSGNLKNSKELLTKASEGLKKWPAESVRPENKVSKINLEKPLMTSSVMAIRDDEMANLNIGVSYNAPSYGSDEAIFHRFYERMVGEYNANDNGVAHLNVANRQYNSAHSLLGNFPGINLFRSEYMGYSDHGLYTNFIHGNEVWGNISLYLAQHFNLEYTKGVNQAEVFRARSKCFVDLMEGSRASIANNLSIGRDLLYMGRRMSRNELARRYSALADPTHILKKSKVHFYDQDISVVTYGPQHMIDNINYFDRSMRKSTLHSLMIQMKTLAL